MQPPNSDFEIRPCLSEYHFYTNNGKKIIDFNELQFGDQLGIEFTLSGLDRIYKNDNDNRISIVVVFYERVGQLGFRLHNIWALYLANLIAIPQHNEILDVKIPMIPKEK